MESSLAELFCNEVLVFGEDFFSTNKLLLFPSLVFKPNLVLAQE